MKPPLGPSLLLATTMLILAGCDPEDSERRPAPRRQGGFTNQTQPVPVEREEVTSTEVEPGDRPGRAPQTPDAAVEPSRTTTNPPPATTGNPEYGKAVPGKPGFVTSPYAPYQGYVDVRGYAPGTEVKDPYTGKIFLVPAQ